MCEKVKSMSEEKKIVEAFRKMCEESMNPDHYSYLVDNIIPALKLARKEMKGVNRE